MFGLFLRAAVNLLLVAVHVQVPDPSGHAVA
jgi:hypothetical protein